MGAAHLQLLALHQTNDNVQKTFHAEFCHLQMRRVSELIAIAVLVAHNELPDFRKKELVKDFNADNLLRQLGKLNAEAFPQVAHILENKDGSVYVLKPIHPKAEIRDLNRGHQGA